jgi:signal transduction histidine kinase
MAFPISIEQRVVGFIFHSSKQLNAFNEHHVKLQLAVSERLAQAIEKAYRMEQLEEMNLAYLELLSFVAHELKSPLASIILDARMLNEALIGTLTDEQGRRAEKIIDKATYLMDLVKDYLDLAKIEGGNLRMNILDDVDFMRDVVQPCVDILAPQVQEKKMLLDIEKPENPLRVQCDPELMRIAVLNLLDNAVKYGNEGGNIAVLLKMTQTGAVFSVWNEGPGFPEAERDKLFRRFSRINTKQLIKEKGTGLGLYTAWRILNLHGGTIDARSEVGLWAEFLLRIPQPVQTDTLL